MESGSLGHAGLGPYLAPDQGPCPAAPQGLAQWSTQAQSSHYAGASARPARDCGAVLPSAVG